MTGPEQSDIERIWTCKIGGAVGELPGGSDLPMREVVEAGYFALTGRRPTFLFSGWGGELTEGERAVVEGRLPDFDLIEEESTRS